MRLRRSICADALDMFATQTRDLSHIELTRSDNISCLSIAEAYRVNEVDISTELKTRARIEGLPFTLALSACVGVPRSEVRALGVHVYMVELSPFVFDRSNAMLAFNVIYEFSAKDIIHFSDVFFI